MIPLSREALLASSSSAFTFRPFYGHTPRPDGALSDACFSQWWPCRFEVDGVEYVTAEQFMMSEKARLFGDEAALEKLLSEPSPSKAKALGRTVKRFDGAVWANERFELVTRGNVAKFSQDEALRAYLLATGSEILVEASPRDRIWGIGLGRSDPRVHQPEQWKGTNLLGFALVRTREILRGTLAAPGAPVERREGAAR